MEFKLVELIAFWSARIGALSPTVCLYADVIKFRAKRGLYSDSIEVRMASLRVSKTSFLVGTRILALLTGASVSDIRGLQIYSLAGLDITMLVNVRVT